MRIKNKVQTSDWTSDWLWNRLGEDEFDFQRDLYWEDDEHSYENRLGFVFADKKSKDVEIQPLINDNVLQTILDSDMVVVPCYMVDGADDIHLTSFSVLPKNRYKPITEEEYKERYVHESNNVSMSN